MNVYSSEKFVVAVFTPSEAREINGLLRSGNIETHFWAAGVSFRAKMQKALRHQHQSADVEDEIIRLLALSPENRHSFNQIRHILGVNGKAVEALSDAVSRLSTEGVIQTQIADNEPVYTLSPGIDPAARAPKAVAADTEAAREDRVKQQLLRLLNRVGGERSKTYIAKGLRLGFAEVELAIDALVGSGELLRREVGKFIFVRLPGTDPDPEKGKPIKKGKKQKTKEEQAVQNLAAKAVSPPPSPGNESELNAKKVLEYLESFPEGQLKKVLLEECGLTKRQLDDCADIIRPQVSGEILPHDSLLWLKKFDELHGRPAAQKPAAKANSPETFSEK